MRHEIQWHQIPGVFGTVGKCTPHSNSDYPGVIQRKSILACSGGGCCAAQRQSKDVVRLALPEKRRPPPTDSSRTAGREAFIVISRANSSNISEFGPERRISSLGWLSVFVYERPLYFCLYLLLSDLLRASFFAMLVFSLSMFVSLSFISLLFFLLRTPSTRSPLVELLSLPLLLFSYPCLRYHPSPTLFRRNSLLLWSSRSPRAFQTLPSSRVPYRSSCNLSSSK